MHKHAHTHTHTQTHTHTHTHTYIHTSLHTHTHTHLAHGHTHTHTHTLKQTYLILYDCQKNNNKKHIAEKTKKGKWEDKKQKIKSLSTANSHLKSISKRNVSSRNVDENFRNEPRSDPSVLPCSQTSPSINNGFKRGHACSNAHPYKQQ